MKNIVLLFLLSVLLSSCGGTRQPDETKMDAPLKLRLAEIEKANSEERILVLGKSSAEISSDLRNELIGTGADIQSVAGNIFTAEGTQDAISKLSHLEFIAYLELAQKNELK